MNSKVSFDFDGTIEFSPVMEYAERLIELGVKVFIVTARNHAFYSDVVAVADYLKIPHHRLIFTNGIEKSIFFEDNEDFCFHLDDDLTTTRYINERTNVIGVPYWANPEWEQDCNNSLSI